MDNFQLISSQRISRTVFEYTYRVDLINSGEAVAGAFATISSNNSNTIVVDDTVSFGDVDASTTITSNDTFSIQHERQVPFDRNNLVFDIRTAQPTNTPPNLQTVNDQSIAEGERRLVSIIATDADNDALTLNALNLPSYADFAIQTNGNATLLLAPNFNDAGETTITLSAFDGEVEVTQTVSLTVTNTNRAPVLTFIGDQSVSEDSSLILNLSANDLDEEALTFTTSPLPPFISLIDNENGTGLLEITTDFNASGNYPITVTVSDGELSDREVFLLNVSGLNRAPILTPIDDVELLENDASTFSINASDPDNESLNFIVRNLPNFISFLDGNNGQAAFNITPSFEDAGIYNVEVSVSDTGGSLLNSTNGIYGHSVG